MKNHKRIMSVMAVALILIMSLSSFAFAELRPIDYEEPKAALTKTLIMGPGTVTPGVKMKFTFTPVTGDERNIGPNGVSITAESTGHAFIPPVNLSIPEGTKANGTQNGSDVVEVQSGNFLEDVWFPSPGIYVYDVEEETCVLTSKKGENVESETLYKSNAKYRMYIHVTNGLGDGGTYITFLGVVQIVKNGTPGSTGWDHSDDEKIDPTPYEIPPTDPEYDYLKNSDMRFVNSFERILKSDPEHELGFLVRKDVAGTIDPDDLNKYFEFEVIINKPPTSTTEKPTTSSIQQANGVGNTPTFVSNEDKINLNELTVEEEQFGQPIVFKLKHWQSVWFRNVPVGSEIEVKEINYDANKWSPEISLRLNNKIQIIKEAQTGKFLQPDYYIEHPDGGGVYSAGATFTNRYKPDTPTGIILNNIPFFLMAAGATVVVVAFAVVKGRKRAANN